MEFLSPAFTEVSFGELIVKPAFTEVSFGELIVKLHFPCVSPEVLKLILESFVLHQHFASYDNLYNTGLILTKLTKKVNLPKRSTW